MGQPAIADLKTAFWADANMAGIIKGWAGKKGKEGEAYKIFKPPKKS